MMKTKTVGVSPKAIAAVITAALTYVLGQEVLALPAWAVLLGQVVLVSIAAYSFGPGTVTTADPDVGKVKYGGERGYADPMYLLVCAIVALILIVVLFKVLDRL